MGWKWRCGLICGMIATSDNIKNILWFMYMSYSYEFVADIGSNVSGILLYSIY